MENISAGLRLGAVFGGVLFAAATQVVLMTLGAAVGLTAFSNADQLQTEVQVGYAVWLLVSLFTSVLIGGYVAAAGSRSPLRKDGLLHGAVTWAAIGLVGFFIVGRNIDGILGGALRLAGRTAIASAPTPEASRVVDEQQRAAQAQVQGTVDRVKHAVSEVGTGLQAAQAANEAREGLAIGLWSFLGAELLLFFAALLGGAMGVNAARRHVRRRAVTAVPVADTIMPMVPRVDLPAT